LHTTCNRGEGALVSIFQTLEKQTFDQHEQFVAFSYIVGSFQIERMPSPAIYYVLSTEQFPIQELIEYGVAAERAGFDGVWASDHFQP
jgi:hypothetical protein